MRAQWCSAKLVVKLALAATLRLAGDEGQGEWSSCLCTMVRFPRKGACRLLVEAQCHKISDGLFSFFGFFFLVLTDASFWSARRSCMDLCSVRKAHVFWNWLCIFIDWGVFRAYLGLVEYMFLSCQYNSDFNIVWSSLNCTSHQETLMHRYLTLALWPGRLLKAYGMK